MKLANFPTEHLNQSEIMPKNQSGDMPKQIGFRPTPEMRADLERARDATGSDLTELVTECVKMSLHAVVQKILSERQRNATRFLKDKKAA